MREFLSKQNLEKYISNENRMYGGNIRGYGSSILTFFTHSVYTGRRSGEKLLSCKMRTA
jgi:membrane carboxypeptidase/penicillin-binding protein PbpC